MLISIIAVSYILAINIFGFRIVKIQRTDRVKNGDPIPNPIPIKQLETKEKSKGTQKAVSETESEKVSAVEVSQTDKTTTHAKSKKKTSTKDSDTPHNGDKLEKDTILAEEKLNMKRYERIPDLKIMLVALFGGALGEYISFLVYKYRTTNTILMVGLPVLVAVWIYLLYIAVARVFII